VEKSLELRHVTARKRLSWQILLPHMGDAPAFTSGVRNSMVRASAFASVVLLARTRAASPDEPCCFWSSRP